jgi:ABC-2 type transport system permease protein
MLHRPASTSRDESGKDTRRYQAPDPQASPLLPSENIMQILGPLLALFSIFGGIFIPLQTAPHVIQTIAKFTPVYGVGESARAPMTHTFHWISVVNIAAWTAAFVIGAAMVFRRDTKRV